LNVKLPEESHTPNRIYVAVNKPATDKKGLNDSYAGKLKFIAVYGDNGKKLFEIHVDHTHNGMSVHYRPWENGHPTKGGTGKHSQNVAYALTRWCREVFFAPPTCNVLLSKCNPVLCCLSSNDFLSDIPKNLRSIGFDADNTLFSEHSWYFRNALVRANYKNAKKGIVYDFRFLELFFRNLLMNEKNELHNRDMLINPPEGWSKATPQVTPQPAPQVPSQKDDTDIFEAEENICSIVLNLAENSFTALQLMNTMNLKDRKSFRTTYLEPAITSKFISMQYPDRPNHPRQKYHLTAKGNALYTSLKVAIIK